MTETDWLRLSPWAVVFIVIKGVYRIVRENIAVLAGVGVGLSFLERISARELVLIAIGLFLLGTLMAVIYHRRFRFRLDGDTLRVRSGLFVRKELKLRAGRVQHLAVEQPVYMRPFSLVELKLDTPGAGKSEVSLPGIPRNLAEALRRDLSSPGATAPVDPEADHADEAGRTETNVVFTAGLHDVLLHGVVNNHAWVLAAILAPLMGNIDEWGERFFGDPELLQAVNAWFPNIWVAVGAALAAVMVIGLLFSVIVSLFRYHDFVLALKPDRLVQRSGLLNRQEQELVARRLQAVEAVQSLAGRLLGRGWIMGRQIGSGDPGTDFMTGRNKFLVPGLAAVEWRKVMAAMWPGWRGQGELRRVHPAYVSVSSLRVAFLGALPAVGLCIGFWTLWWLLLPFGVWVLLRGVMYLRWRVLGWSRSDGYINLRRGLVARRMIVFPAGRVQSVEILSSPYQRRNDLATLVLVLAHGPVRIPFMPLEDAMDLADYCLYAVEAGRLPDEARPYEDAGLSGIVG